MNLVFSSAIFLFVFLPCVFLLYRLIPGLRAKNILLALASIVFYAFGQLQYVPLFLLSVLINYFSGLILTSAKAHRKIVLALAVILNLGILCVFKYTDFILQNLNLAFHTALAPTGIVLPIGISFFTFQGLSYTIDVYRDPKSGTKNFLKLLLYISFFPQLIAGPIVKYHDISEQIDSRSCTAEETAAGVRRFITGLSKKILISNAVGYIADAVFNDYLHSFSGSADWRLLWLGGICYTLQIYYDFSGYSDMAIGMGHMFGFTILENFKHPYTATSIRDFWRRWHVSLSSWFREYLYIPLGGNRKGRFRTVLNRMIVFFCTGIWHGANWTFVVWGLCHGLLSSLEGAGIIPAEKLQRTRAGRLLGRIYTLLAVMLLFVVFRADSLSDAALFIGSMFTGGITAEGTLLLHELLNPAAVTVLLVSVLCAGGVSARMRSVGDKLQARNPAVMLSANNLLHLGLLVLSVFSLSRGGFNPFIYFQF